MNIEELETKIAQLKRFYSTDLALIVKYDERAEMYKKHAGKELKKLIELINERNKRMRKFIEFCNTGVMK